MKRFLLALTFSAGALTALPAHADPEIYFYPAHGWNVDYLTAEQSGMASQSCYISTTFNNGFLMQLSGGESWVEAMEVDFLQEAFEPGAMYDVGLSVPGLSELSVPAQATSPSTLSIGLKGNREFYKNMRNSSVLDFTMDGNVFRFYMVGFSGKADSFEKCLTGSTVVAKTGYPLEDVKEAVENPPEKPAAKPLKKPAAAPASMSEATRPAAVKGKDEAEVIPDTLPPMQLRRNGRKRMTERLAEEMANNPDMASVRPERDQRPDLTIYDQQPITIPGKTAPPVNYDMEDLPAPDWNAYQPQKEADGAPSNLVIPPGYTERP